MQKLILGSVVTGALGSRCNIPAFSPCFGSWGQSCYETTVSFDGTSLEVRCGRNAVYPGRAWKATCPEDISTNNWQFESGVPQCKGATGSAYRITNGASVPYQWRLQDAQLFADPECSSAISPTHQVEHHGSEGTSTDAMRAFDGNEDTTWSASCQENQQAGCEDFELKSCDVSGCNPNQAHVSVVFDRPQTISCFRFSQMGAEAMSSARVELQKWKSVSGDWEKVVGADVGHSGNWQRIQLHQGCDELIMPQGWYILDRAGKIPHGESVRVSCDVGSSFQQFDCNDGMWNMWSLRCPQPDLTHWGSNTWEDPSTASNEVPPASQDDIVAPILAVASLMIVASLFAIFHLCGGRRAYFIFHVNSLFIFPMPKTFLHRIVVGFCIFLSCKNYLQIALALARGGLRR